MEDDKGLELSLGLGCGRTTSASNDKSGNSADDRTDTDERTSKILNDFRNFLNAGVPQTFQTTNSAKPQENFFNHIQRTVSGGNDSTTGSGAGQNKRKSTFEELSTHKKQETDSLCSDLQDKEKHSHISITTDEGSTGDNEDVAESEAEGSTSRMVSHQDDGSRTPGGSASSSQAPKETNGLANISASSFPVQTLNSSVPYSISINESTPASAPSTSIYPLSMQNIPPTNGDRPVPHAASTKSIPMTFTYSPVQIPDKDSPWGMTRPPSLHSPYAGNGRSAPTSVSMQVTNSSPSGAAQPDVRPLQQLRGPPILVVEEGSSSHSEGDAAHGGARPTSFPSEYPAIRPGIASEVKFGGSGSFPNLPWVSTTGPGPNGKTISGVTYKFNATQIKIVCACHGIHMSPEDFVRHVSEDQQNAVTPTSLASLRSSNPATTSAKS